ncbi:MAG TPA: hypothetical protein VJ653_08365 [Acidimicrobiales bacterium]|nr:hypothetical protein [Acidimicrobiales bacterium]
MRAVRIGLVAVLLSLGVPAVWAQTIPTSTVTTSPSTIPSGPGTTTTTVHFECPGPGGIIIPCSSTTTSTVVGSNPLAGLVCPLLAGLRGLFAPIGAFLQSLLQVFGCAGG